MHWIFLLGLLISYSVRADDREGWLALSLEPIIDPAVTLVFHGDQGELRFEDDEIAVSVQCPRADVGPATTFSIRILNKSGVPLRFQERMVSFHGSNDSRNWIPVPLVPAAESKLHRQTIASGGRMDGQLPVFLHDTTIKPKDSYAALVEHGHHADDPEYRYYRLSVGAPRKTAHFHFENVRLRGPDPRLDPTQPGFIEQWRRRSQGGTAADL